MFYALDATQHLPSLSCFVASNASFLIELGSLTARGEKWFRVPISALLCMRFSP